MRTSISGYYEVMKHMDNAKKIFEGLLFLSGDEGLSSKQIYTCLKEDMTLTNIEETLDALMKEYGEEAHGIELVCYGGIYKFVSKECVHPYAQQLFSSTKMASLSSAAMETLAIVAYKQPVTRVEIEDIRGVNCDMMLRKLLARNLIQECGRSDMVGKPFLYRVTKQFMDTFKLASLKELPELPDFKETVQEELFER